MEHAGGSRNGWTMDLENASDHQLLKWVLAGEETAFVALYRRWQRNIFRFALRVSNSRSVAEDVTQEVFLALMNSRLRFDAGLGSFSSYIYGIARNHTLRRIRRERFYTPMVPEEFGTRSNGVDQDKPDSNPLAQLAHREKIESLHNAIAALPLHYREIVALCELQELDYGEAARIVGCPEGTVRSRLHRARVLLQEKLRKKSNDGGRAQEIEPARCQI
jgi:RNA polymerase sigma-70 factor (ECF subfamily)